MKQHDTERELQAFAVGDATRPIRITPADQATQPALGKLVPPADAAFVLRFLSGPRAGSEVALAPGSEYVFGRGKEADLVLGEDLVSRRHALLSLAEATPTLADLGSTNGTFINGERISRAPLRPGDRLLIGTTIARFVEVDEEETKVGLVGRELLEPLRKTQPASTMAGRLEEVPLVDLLQLFCNSRKSGAIVVRDADAGEGSVLLKAGQIVSARLEGRPHLTHRKVLARLLRVERGAFEFVPPGEVEPAPAPSELQEPTELLLMDSLRLIDELRVLEPELPPAAAVLAPVLPLPGRLRTLEPDALDLFQLALERRRFGEVVEHTSLDDVAAVRGLLRLVSLGYLQVQA